eukprot:gene2590-3343_t
MRRGGVVWVPEQLFPPECPEVDEMAQAFPEAQAAWDDYNRRRAGKSAVPQPSDGRPSQNFDSLSEAELSDLAYQRLHPQATACRSPEDAGRWPAVREGEAYLAHKYNLTLVSMCNVFRVLMGDPSLGSLVQGCLLSRVLIDMLPNGGFELGEDVDDVEYTSWGPMRTAGPPPPPLTYLQSNSIELPSTKTRCMESQPAEGREHGFNVNATSLKGWIIQEDDRHGHRQRWYEAAATDAYMELSSMAAAKLIVSQELRVKEFSVEPK